MSKSFLRPGEKNERAIAKLFFRDRWTNETFIKIKGKYRVVVNITNNSQKQPPGVFCKKRCSQNSKENTCASVALLIKLQASVCNFIEKETLAQVFFCEFCEISKNTFFTEHLLETASG